MQSMPLFPPSASSVATEMDLLYFFIVAVCGFFTVLVVALVVFFTIKFKRTHPDQVGADIHGSLALELFWTAVPFVLSLVMFGWGASLFFRMSRPPAGAMEMTVVGKQWMWKIQHPEGGARSTSCTCRSACRSGSRLARKTSSTISSSRRFG